jgi:hypothetical protein
MQKDLQAFLALVGAAILVSCGGGSELPALTDGTHALNAQMDRTVLASQPAPQALATAPVVDVDSLFNWAEGHFPQYFPSHQATLFSSPYLYRHYPETDIYVGVDGQFVRVLGGAFGPDIVTVGVLSDFTCAVFPASCPPQPVNNQPPTANAGPSQQAYAGSPLLLRGSGTDPEGAALTYQWTLLSKPAGSAAAIVNSTSATATLQTDYIGTYVAGLVVSDGSLSSAQSTVTISAISQYGGFYD